MTNSYEVGSGNPPGWCRQYISPFKKMDGTIAYEFYGKHESFILEKGEVLVKDAEQIIIPDIRKKRELTR
jgi:hypothetical protein